MTLETSHNYITKITYAMKNDQNNVSRIYWPFDNHERYMQNKSKRVTAIVTAYPVVLGLWIFGPRQKLLS